MLRTLPKITYGDAEPFTEFVFPELVDDYDDQIVLSMGGEAPLLNGDVESTFWHSVIHIQFTCPIFLAPEKADFMNHHHQWLKRSKTFRFYPDKDGDSFFQCKISAGWTPKWQPIQPGTVWRLACDFRRIDPGEME